VTVSRRSALLPGGERPHDDGRRRVARSEPTGPLLPLRSSPRAAFALPAAGAVRRAIRPRLHRTCRRRDRYAVAHQRGNAGGVGARPRAPASALPGEPGVRGSPDGTAAGRAPPHRALRPDDRHRGSRPRRGFPRTWLDASHHDALRGDDPRPARDPLPASLRTPACAMEGCRRASRPGAHAVRRPPPHVQRRGRAQPAPAHAPAEAPARAARAWTTDASTIALAALVTDRDKLVMDARARRLALYDLASDPGETRDVAPSKPWRARRLARRLRAAGEARALAAAGRGAVDDQTARRLRALGYAE